MESKHVKKLMSILKHPSPRQIKDGLMCSHRPKEIKSLSKPAVNTVLQEQDTKERRDQI